MEFPSFSDWLFRRKKTVEHIDGPKLVTTKPTPKPALATTKINAPIRTDVHGAPPYQPANTDTSLKATSVAKFFEETFNPYKYSKFRELYQYDEPSFYKDYEYSVRQNPYTAMVVEFVLNETFANDFHFEGPGANVIENFFFEDNTRAKIKLAWRESVKKGNGFIDLTTKGTKLVKTTVVPSENITVIINQKGEREYTGSINTGQPYVKLNSENLIHFMLRENPGEAYGISLLRPNYIFLTALYDMGGDIVSAMKRTAYAPIVAKLDLENYTEEEKPAVVENYRQTLEEIDSATNNIVVDKRHEIDLLGSGGGGARLLPTNDLIEPIVSVVLMNFGVPLGLYLQTGANKAIIDEQRKAMNRFYEDMRTRIKYYVEKKIVPLVTNRNCKLVFNHPPVNNEETQKALLVHTAMFKEGILSREWILDYWEIDDKGTPIDPNPVKPPTTAPVKANEEE